MVWIAFGADAPLLREAMAVLRAGAWIPHAAILLTNTGTHVAVVLTAIALAAAFTGAGVGGLGWFLGNGGSATLWRWGTAPLGAGLIAAVSWSLLLTRLWFPLLLVAATILPVLLFAPVVIQRIKGIRFTRLTTAEWAVVAGGLLLLPWLLAPETHDDCWAYALAFPRHWLREHGLVTRGAYAYAHFPFLLESLDAVPLWLDLDQIPKWINLGLVCCGAGALLDGVDREGRGWGWAGLLCASSGYVILSGKNEGAMAGFALLAFVSGRESLRPGSRCRPLLALGAGFAALGLATKATAALGLAWVPLALALEGGVPGIAAAVSLMAMAAAAAAPFYLKAWMLTGDPVYPVVAGPVAWPVIGWDARGAAVWRSWIGTAPGWAGLRSLPEHLAREEAAFAWLLPAWLLLRGPDWPIGASCLLSYAGWHLLSDNFQLSRLALPALLPALVAGGAALPAIFRRTGFPPAVIVALLLVAGGRRLAVEITPSSSCLNPNPIPYLLGAESRVGHVRTGLTVLDDVAPALAQAGPGHDVILTGEIRTYGFSAWSRMGFEPTGAARPLLWQLAGESGDARTLLKKYRQLGSDRLAYNVVRGESSGLLQAPFVWTDRALAVHRDFCGRGLDPVYTPPRIDARHGGVYVYRIRRTLRAAAPAFLLHLPGTEGVLAPAALEPDASKSLALALDAVRRAPNVGMYLNAAGYAARNTGDFALAYRLYRPGVRAGQLDEENVLAFSLCAFVVGRLDEALAGFSRAAVVYPDQREIAEGYLARTRFRIGLRSNGRRADPASLELEREFIDAAKWQARR